MLSSAQKFMFGSNFSLRSYALLLGRLGVRFIIIYLFIDIS